MLADTFRFHVYNASGEALTSGDINIEIRFFKYGTDGSTTYSAEFTCDNNATINNAAYGTVIDAGSAETDYDNTSNKYVGFHGRVTVATATGTGAGVDVYLQWSPDAGTDWPQDGSGILLAHVDTPGADTYEEQLTY